MATFVLKISDNEDETLQIECDFGDGMDKESSAHQLGGLLVEFMTKQITETTED